MEEEEEKSKREEERKKESLSRVLSVLQKSGNLEGELRL